MNDKRALKRPLNEKHRWMESLSSSGGAFFHILWFYRLSEKTVDSFFVIVRKIIPDINQNYLHFDENLL